MLRSSVRYDWSARSSGNAHNEPVTGFCRARRHAQRQQSNGPEAGGIMGACDRTAGVVSRRRGADPVLAFNNDAVA